MQQCALLRPLSIELFIMRPLKYLPIIALFLAPALAIAQQNAPAPGNQPPRLERLEEGNEPAITIRKPEAGKKATEQREGGKVKQITVQSGPSTYYVKPNEQPGTSVPGDAESNVTRPAQWQLFEFDFGRRKESREIDSVQTLEPAPPPPVMPPSPAKR